MCATHNVSMSTKAVILRELKRGGDIVDKIFLGSLQWHDLFTRHTFFSQDYKYYLCIISSSRSKDAQSVWSGLVESKLRLLVGALDKKPSIEIAHPFPKGFERVHFCKSDKDIESVKNGSTQYQAEEAKIESTDQTNDSTCSGVQNGDACTVYTTTYYIGLELKPLAPGRDIGTSS